MKWFSKMPLIAVYATKLLSKMMKRSNIICTYTNLVTKVQILSEHILCQSLGLFKDADIKVIPQNLERYVSFSLNKLRFIDSFQFLPSNLEALVENLAQDDVHSFANRLSEFDSQQDAQLLLRKGVYPYEYMDNEDNF